MSQHSNEGEMEQFASSLIETVEKPNKSLVANHRVGSRVRRPTEQGYWHGVRDLISGSWVPGGVGCNLLSPLQWICAIHLKQYCSSAILVGFVQTLLFGSGGFLFSSYLVPVLQARIVPY